MATIVKIATNMSATIAGAMTVICGVSLAMMARTHGVHHVDCV